MIGRFVEQQYIRIGDPDAGDQSQALPPAAEFGELPIAHCCWGVQKIEYHADLPGAGFSFRGRKRPADRVVQWEVQEGGGDVLFYEADAQAATADDVACARVRLAGKAAQQGGFAGAIAGDQSYAVRVVDGEVEVLEEDARREYAEVTHIDEAHGGSLVSVVAEATGRHAEEVTERAVPDERRASDPAFDPPRNMLLRGVPGSA